MEQGEVQAHNRCKVNQLILLKVKAGNIFRYKGNQLILLKIKARNMFWKRH
jgi:hypothetical protein